MNKALKFSSACKLCCKLAEAYERQIHELEDETERTHAEYSKLEKSLEKYKAENTELKTMVRFGQLNFWIKLYLTCIIFTFLKLAEMRRHKEQEESLHVDINNFKAEIK